MPWKIYTSSGFPDNGTEYQWTVCAGNSAGWSSWSTYWNFTNGSKPAPKPAPEPQPEPDRESEVIYIEWPPPGSGHPPGGGTQPPQSSCTQQQSEQIARQFVLNDSYYSKYSIYNNDLVNVVKVSGISAWRFTYLVEYDANSGPEINIAMIDLVQSYIEVTVINCQIVSVN